MKPLFPATLAPTPQARAVAAEFLIYCRGAGLTNAEIMALIRCPCLANPTYDTTLDAIERTWLALIAGWRHPLEGTVKSHIR